MARIVLGLVVFMILSCAPNQRKVHPVLGPVLESTYQVANYSKDESGFNMRIVVRNSEVKIEFDSLNFRGYRAKSITVGRKGNKTELTTYIPLTSRKIKGFRRDKTKEEDGLYFSLNGISYFHTLKFKNTL